MTGRETPARPNEPSDPIERIERKLNKTLASVQEIRALLEPSDTGEEDPIRVMKRYLLWLFRHVGSMERRLDDIGSDLRLLMSTSTIPRQQQRLSDEEPEEDVF